MKTQAAKRLHWLITAPLLIGSVILGYTTQSKASGLGINIIGDRSINFHTVNMNGLRFGNKGKFGSNPSEVSLHRIQGHAVRTSWPNSRKHMNLQAT